MAFVGDGRNNVARSLMIICAKLGINITIIAPKELFPAEDIVSLCNGFAEKSGSKITISHDISLVKDADSVYTDVWTSMGEEAHKETRKAMLKPYQVNKALMAATGKDSTVFMHCLPAIKGEEVTEEVFEGPQSLVWEQAENRKHTIKAIMLALL